MEESESIGISFCRWRSLVYAMASLLFVLVSVFGLLVGSIKLFSLVWFAVCGSILLFGFCTVVFLSQVLRRGPALVIDSQGVTENSTSVSVGFVLWKDILEFSRIRIHGRNGIAIKVRNPESYLQRRNGVFAQWSLKTTQNWYGTPICINADALNFDVDELERLLESRWNQYLRGRQLGSL